MEALAKLAMRRKVIQKTQSILEEAIGKMCNDDKLPKCLRIADLGCSSGPNTLLVISNIINAIYRFCDHHHKYNDNGREVLEIHVSLNDLPKNDFNTIFKSLPTFYEKLKMMMMEKGDMLIGHVFISGIPGSFYGRLFPTKSLNLVHSSYSLHWLSQVPKILESNKGNIYIGKLSPTSVHEAYLMQFQNDFTTFLNTRYEEIVSGGHMVLTFLGRSDADPTSSDSCSLFMLLTKSLLELVAEGFVKEVDVDSLNLPFYLPYKDEVKAVIQKEGSFELDRLECFQVNWDGSDDIVDEFRSGNVVASTTRAVMEPLLASHFGGVHYGQSIC